MVKLYNKHHKDAPAEAVYIGRPSKWGNPFVVGRDGARGECVQLYADWLEGQPELKEQMRKELRGKDLVCFCVPNICHGHIIADVANDGK